MIKKSSLCSIAAAVFLTACAHRPPHHSDQIAALIENSGTSSSRQDNLRASQIPRQTRTTTVIGYVEFCNRRPVDSLCNAYHTPNQFIADTAENEDILFHINTDVNHEIAPANDITLYNQEEYWAYPTHSGDCEDYALRKRNILIDGYGFPESALNIMVVVAENGEGHAVLGVHLKNQDNGRETVLILDNRNNDILTMEQAREAGYRFIKQPSRVDPRIWVKGPDYIEENLLRRIITSSNSRVLRLSGGG